MLSSIMVGLLGLLATLSSASPVAPPLQHNQARQANSTSPCAQVASTIYFPNLTLIESFPTVPAKLAYDCLLSIPFNATSARKLVDNLWPLLEWQSTINGLKSPPADYVAKVQPPVDIANGLNIISDAIDAGTYKSEYEFGWALYTLIQSAHDGHFSYIPDSVGSVFSFGRKIPLISVSEDGVKLPVPFAFEDVLGAQFKNISYAPSPIVEINGMDATKYLEKFSQFGSLQDRDALYNNMFYNLAQVSLGSSGAGTGMFTGGGRGRFVYPDAVTTLKFANGTTSETENYARVLASFRGIKSGEELAASWFYYGSGAADPADPNEQKTPAATSPEGSAYAGPGYPDPVVPGPSGLINGFYINDPKYADVAILQVPNFVGDQSAELAFQRTTQQFLPKALADGKTKLIIDVQANGGGTILQGYDMFKQLFPTIEPLGYNRFRATQAGDLIGQAFSSFAKGVPRVYSSNTSTLSVIGSYFDYHTDLDAEGKHFDSWSDKVGPEMVNGDSYTNIHRWDLNDPLIQWSSGGINITGYGPLVNVSKIAPFKAENIVLLTDGYCASTCTIFSEFLTKQAGVKTIAMGGRSNKDKIQAIGGVKGTNNYGWSYIQSLAGIAIRVAPEEEKAKYNSSVLRTEITQNLVVSQRAATSPGVNVRDGLAIGDDSGVALQFIYEEADCRLYYTPEMAVDAQAIWKAAADAQWGKSGKCVSGAPTYGEKRDVQDITTKLGRRRINVSNAMALKKVAAFEDSFALETECQWEAGGFMRP